MDNQSNQLHLQISVAMNILWFICNIGEARVLAPYVEICIVIYALIILPIRVVKRHRRRKQKSPYREITTLIDSINQKE